MRADLGVALTLVIGVIFIVFNEVVGRKMNDIQNMIAPRARSAKRTRIICIMIGTIYVIYASMSLFR
jgi:hypothetical protein